MLEELDCSLKRRRPSTPTRFAGDRLHPPPPFFSPSSQEIIYIHQAIRSALHSFAQEARALLTVEGGVTPAQLTALAEHYRFIRAVCTFHSASEDDVVFPALKHIVQQQQQQQGQQQGLQQQQQRGHLQQPPVHQGHPGLQQHHHHPPHVQQAAVEGPPQVGLARLGCEDEHSEEITRLEELGRLLVNVRVSARCVGETVGDVQFSVEV